MTLFVTTMTTRRTQSLTRKSKFARIAYAIGTLPVRRTYMYCTRRHGRTDASNKDICVMVVEGASIVEEEEEGSVEEDSRFDLTEELDDGGDEPGGPPPRRAIQWVKKWSKRYNTWYWADPKDPKASVWEDPTGDEPRDPPPRRGPSKRTKKQRRNTVSVPSPARKKKIRKGEKETWLAKIRTINAFPDRCMT